MGGEEFYFQFSGLTCTYVLTYVLTFEEIFEDVVI